jgi:hypothetical protein
MSLARLYSQAVAAAVEQSRAAPLGLAAAASVPRILARRAAAQQTQAAAVEAVTARRASVVQAS